MVDVGAGDVVRSLEGHAAVSMGGTDDRWILIQLNTFTNWVNEQLRTLDMSVENLQTDLCDGKKLCALMQQLQGGKRIGRVMKKPMNQHHYLENVSIALRAMQNDNIRLVNIGSEDIVNGNMKLIMGVIWHLILRYQIGKSKLAPKKLMLAWLSAVIPQCNITNFHHDWNDGIALSALLEYCKPGLFPDWQKLSRRDGLNNCRVAMEKARDEFGIPLVLSPENLSSPDLDELSGMTYISYFMMVDSPGYNATMKFVQEQIPELNVKNFKSDWNDGTALAAMTASYGEPIEGWPHNYPNNDHEGTCQKAINAGLKLGVNPVIPAKDICDPEVDHIGVMAYAAWFQHLKSVKQASLPPPIPAPVQETPLKSAPTPPPSPPPVVVSSPSPSPPPPPPPIVPLEEQLILDADMSNIKLNIPKIFQVSGLLDPTDSGKVRAEVKGPSSRLLVESHWSGDTCHCAFTPTECGQHQLVVYANNEPITGCPLSFYIPPDSSKVSLLDVEYEQIVNNTSRFKVDTTKAGSGKIRVDARSPSGRVQELSTSNNNGVFTANFTPSEVGEWVISILHEGENIKGSPFNVRVYDAGQVRVLGLEGATLGKQFTFQADTRGAGQGVLTADVTLNGRNVPTDVVNDGQGLYRITFTPVGAGTYIIRVHFSGMEVTGSPFTLEIVDASQVTVSGEGVSSVAVNRLSTFLVSTRGAGSGEVKVNITAPNGELVPAQILTQPDGDYKVEYSSKYTGKHMVEILYSGQAVMGSPFYVEIYDPNKIKVEGHRTGIVGQLHGFDLNRDEAGKAELGIRIISPSGRTVSYDIKQVQTGEHVSYMPDEDGVYKIYITYGGLEVPGCPLTQTINQAGIPAAHGDGLTTGEEGKPTVFHVDSKGMRGDLFVQVDAPNSIAKCNVVPEHDGTYTVTYTPVEVGVYTVLIKWNGREIPGSPFHPSIINPNKIIFPDGLLDSSNRMALTVSQRKEFQFDGRGAGRGTLTADVRGPHGEKVIEHVESHGNGLHTVSFTPPVEGNYRISLYWNGISLPRSPFSGYAQKQEQPADHSKVVLTGRGLKEAQMHEEAEFVIDGSQAGAGEPSVKLSSTKAEVNVQVVPLGGGRYRCTYVPTVSGAYLLYIKWSDSHVVGSPFKVNVGPLGDSRKVVCYGEGLKVGIMGKEIKSTIDTRRAGPGELTAFCEGPSQRSSAYCELTDHKDGTFTLHVRPQEAGRHVLHVKYGGEHVPGSPFVLRISGAPDASKVRVYGPGVEHGILATFQSTFFCETRGAGAGQLTVRIRGPKAAFRVEMQRESQKDRRIQCRYDPTEVGDYIIHVRWSGDNVPGSPFRVQIFDTREELEHFLSNNPGQKGSVHPNQPWNGEI